MVASILLISTALFILGAAVGSFLNVVIMRSAAEEDWVRGRSRCDHCGTVLQWFDMIPLLSFWLLRGRCRYCGKPIAVNHPVVEILTGSLFVWWYWFGFFFFSLAEQPFIIMQPIFWLLVGMILLLIFFADLWYYLIPDSAVILLTLLAVVYRAALVNYGVMRPEDLTRMVVGVFGGVGFLYFLWFATKKRGMGFGDVKLMMPIGLLLGWQSTIVCLFLAFTTGGVVGAYLLATRQKSLKQPIPFGPFLIAAALVSLIWGDQVFLLYMQMIFG